jgi:hypothetical protein
MIGKQFLRTDILTLNLLSDNRISVRSSRLILQDIMDHDIK